jgi:hypothetical protein
MSLVSLLVYCITGRSFSLTGLNNGVDAIRKVVEIQLSTIIYSCSFTEAEAANGKLKSRQWALLLGVNALVEDTILNWYSFTETVKRLFETCWGEIWTQEEESGTAVLD